MNVLLNLRVRSGNGGASAASQDAPVAAQRLGRWSGGQSDKCRQPEASVVAPVALCGEQGNDPEAGVAYGVTRRRPRGVSAGA